MKEPSASGETKTFKVGDIVTSNPDGEPVIFEIGFISRETLAWDSPWIIKPLKGSMSMVHCNYDGRGLPMTIYLKPTQEDRLCERLYSFKECELAPIFFKSLYEKTVGV